MVSKAVELIRKDRYASLTLKVSKNLAANCLVGLEDLKDISARMADGRSGDYSEEEKMFWDLVNIKAGNMIESLESIQKHLEGEDDA